MKKLALLSLCALLLPACGYHLGGLKNPALRGKDSFCMTMFANYSTQPMASELMTTALGDALQRDGTFKLKSPDKADFSVSGSVMSIRRCSLSTNYADTYISSELGLVMRVRYEVTDNKTGLVICSGQTEAQGSYFNNEGNVQSARDAALSYASRRAAEDIVDRLTL